MIAPTNPATRSPFFLANQEPSKHGCYSRAFCRFGMKPVIDTDTTYYCVGVRTAVGINAPAPEHAGAAFEQKRVGLHHLCFRARERVGVEASIIPLCGKMR